jgi:2-(1,2-epoxy-1,2-dihydrophenyl)acetyl-CoA isomerase
MYTHIEVSYPAEKVCQIALNRPRQFNALAALTFEELRGSLKEFEESDNNVLILTGSGRAFCFGADFQEFQAKEKLPALLESFQSLILQLYNCSKPTIAALNGFATGAGLDLALACDFRIASDRAKLGEAYISMGLVSDGGGSFFLPQLLGVSRALSLLLTGDSIEASRAMDLGLVHSITTQELLPQAALDLASALAKKPQTALRLLKKLVKQNAGSDLETSLRNERNAQLICFDDRDHILLVNQYLDRRFKKQES